MAASKRGLPVFQPERIRKEPAFIQTLSQLAPDVIIVVAFGQILPESVLKIPQLGCINLHASLLPKYRGAAPIQWSIIRGERETGVTTMQMDVGMDTGPILLKRATPIAPDETAEALSSRLAEIGGPLLIETLSRLRKGDLTPIPQEGSEATMAPLLKKEDGVIRWEESAEAIYNRWRGVIPWPGTTTYYRQERWKIPALAIGSWEGRRGRPGEIVGRSEKGLEVAAGIGYILIEKLQLEGGKEMTIREYAAARPIEKGTLLRSREAET
jgi:methionyl-tRNA formyltransferase